MTIIGLYLHIALQFLLEKKAALQFAVDIESLGYYCGHHQIGYGFGGVVLTTPSVVVTATSRVYEIS